MTCAASTVIAGAGLALAAGGTAMTVAGQSQAAGAAAGQAQYQSQVARNNQIIAERNATLAKQQGDVQATQKQQQTAQIIGAQRAALASQGGDVDSGSPLDIQGDTARAGFTDAATIRSNAALTAYGYEVQANSAGASADNFSRAGANATANLPFGIGSSLLGGASSLAKGAYTIMKNNPGNTSPTYGPEFDL